MSDWPEYARREGNTIYVQTAAQAWAIIERDDVSDGDFVVVEDPEESRQMMREVQALDALMRVFG